MKESKQIKLIDLLQELMNEAEEKEWSEEVKKNIEFLIDTLVAWGEIDNYDIHACNNYTIKKNKCQVLFSIPNI